jgi:hypothetical protein
VIRNRTRGRCALLVGLGSYVAWREYITDSGPLFGTRLGVPDQDKTDTGPSQEMLCDAENRGRKRLQTGPVIGF